MKILKDFPKLEDWSYVDLVTFYNKAISWKIDFEKELRELLMQKEWYSQEELVKEILGES